jgi:endonuclease/exonuclease/phosphatase family metal-dependent hydrolase
MDAVRKAVAGASIGATMLTVLAVGVLAADAAGAAARRSGRPGITVVDLNLLHGAFCPAATNACDAPDRVALLADDLEAVGCPDVVGLQEIDRELYRLVKRKARTMCHGDYQLVFGPPTGLDTELVLTKLPVTGQKVEKLFGGFRTASRVGLQSDLGPVALVVTHQDGDPAAGTSAACNDHCPPVCTPATPAFECQTVAAAKLADGKDDKGTLRILMGDFNVTPASARYQHLVQDGWLDAYFDAGNPECDPTTGDGCTSGRDDKSLTSLQDPANRENERIDYIFVKPPAGCRPGFDPAEDANGNRIGTGLFAGTPAVAGPGGLAWPSDHIGVSMDMSCLKKAKKGNAA